MKAGFMRCMFSAFLLIASANLADAIDLNDADQCECKNKIVSIGDTKYDVIEKCGEPSSRETNGSVWVYDFGSTKFVYYITFVDDIVERIQYGEYGHETTE